jgi:thiamine biosynthesis lipoprotein
MGTRATLAARAPQRAGAMAALDAVLASLEQTESDLSTWRDTPFNRLNRLPERTPVQLDEALCGIVRELDAWTRRTDGAFDAAVGPLIDLWGVQRRARVPQGREVQAALPRSRLNAWQFDEAECTLSRPSGGRLDSGGFGKGEAIDRAVRQPAAAAWLVDLGGQVGVCACGDLPNSDGWRVGIAHPRIRDRVLFEVTLRSGSLATSGGSERDQRAHGRRVSHILDPRTGTPATFDGSVVVWHARGLVADILSTALYVMGPAKGLRWAERNGIAVCFLVPEGPDVRVRASTEFRRRFRLQGISSS